MTPSNQPAPETIGHEQFQRGIALLQAISAWHLRAGISMLPLLALAIVLILFPSLLPSGVPAHVLISALLGVLWAASAFTVHHLRSRLAKLRETLIDQRDGAAKQRERANKLYGLSIMDPLTRLYNRRFGESRLQEEITRAEESSEPLLLVAMDFDGFKQINDKFGHAAGDMALKVFSRRLQNSVRACDVPIRCGGDEFLVIFPGCPPETVPVIFSRMDSIVITYEGTKIPVRFSYGMAQYQVSDTPESFIKRADERLYAVKAKRKAKAASEKAEQDRMAEAEKIAEVASRNAGASSRNAMGAARCRRGVRIPKTTKINLTGNDLGGAVFHEPTVAVELSLHGAVIISRHKLAPEQHVIIRCPATNQETEARIVRVIESQSERHTYGIELENPVRNIWDIEFPPLEEHGKSAPHSLLECQICNGREITHDADAASSEKTVDIIAGRFCKRCGSATTWQRINAAEENSLAVTNEVAV